MQAYKIKPQLIDGYKDSIIAAANAICAKGFPTTNDGTLKCDGMLQECNNSDSDLYNCITAWINRIALLILAYNLVLNQTEADPIRG